MAFPNPDGAIVEDEEQQLWVTMFALFGAMTGGKYDVSPRAYQLSTEHDSPECGACLRGECVQRLVWAIDEGFVYIRHDQREELS
jgi:hypothetical protein